MRITGTRWSYPDVDGCSVSMSNYCVILTSLDSYGEMLEPHDARELAAQLTKAANHLISLNVKAAIAAGRSAGEGT